MNAVASPLTLLLNQQSVYTYDRNRRLPGKQREFLDFMQQDMSEGIELDGIHYSQPDAQQQAYYVAMSLVHAYDQGNAELMFASSAYLATRYPGLNQVVVESQDDNFSLQLIFAEE